MRLMAAAQRLKVKRESTGSKKEAERGLAPIKDFQTTPLSSAFICGIWYLHALSFSRRSPADKLWSVSFVPVFSSNRHLGLTFSSARSLTISAFPLPIQVLLRMSHIFKDGVYICFYVIFKSLKTILFFCLKTRKWWFL